MHTRPLGNSGFQASAIGLGGMPLSVRGDRPSEVDGIAVIHHAIACGVNFIDTADAYCKDDTEAGHNERLIGKAISQLPPAQQQKIMVATKGGLVRPQGRWEHDGKPAHLRKVCEESIRNLRVEHIGLYQYHRIDPKVPLEESWGELVRLQQEGKIAHLGASNHSVEELTRARKIANIVSLQNEYSRKHRNPETDGTLAYTIKNQIAFLPWSPLDGMGGSKNLDANYPVIARIAQAHSVSIYQVVLAWLLAKGPMVIPIPGASRKASIEDSAKAADLQLSVDELLSLEKP